MKNLNKIITIIALCAFSSYAIAGEYLVLGGNASKDLGKMVAQKLNTTLCDATIGSFNDGEISIKIEKSVRDKDVYIIQSIAKSSHGSINDNLMELYLMVRTLKRANAGTITAIIPYYGYARQDRKTESRVPISASDVAMLLENSGVDRVVALDLHAGQIQGFFHNVPVDNIYGSIFMTPIFSELKLKNPVIVSPDAGGVARAKKFRDTLGMYGIEADFAIIIKQRAGAGVIESANLIGDVKDRDVIIVDDICDTGGTLVKAAEELKKFGANRIYASITHAVFSKDAIDKIEKSSFEQVYVSDSIEIKPGKYKKITQISVANLLAMIVTHLDQGESLSDLFMPKKSYIEEYGISKVIPQQAVFPKFAVGAKLALDNLQPINVLVTSSSELKIKAAKAIFKKKLGVNSNNLSVKGYKSNSGVSDQPIGIEMASLGAKNRILDLKRLVASNIVNKSYIVSIENFIEVKGDSKPTDHALVIIEAPDGRQYTYLSDGVEVATEIYRSAIQHEHMTVGQVLAQKYKISSNDWYNYVTGHKIDRVAQILSAF